MKIVVDLSKATLSELNREAADLHPDTLLTEAIRPFDDIAARATSNRSGFLQPRRGFTPFNVGEVWYSPRRKLYRVVSQQTVRGEVAQAVLQAITGTTGRKIRRDVAATRNWCRVRSYVIKKERGNPEKIHLAESSSSIALCDTAVSWKSFRLGCRGIGDGAADHFCSICARKGEPSLALAAAEIAHFKDSGVPRKGGRHGALSS